MFNWITKGDLQKLLAAGGTSLETVLQQAGREAQHATDAAAVRIVKNQKVIAEAQAAITTDTAAVKEAAVITRLVNSLGGG